MSEIKPCPVCKTGKLQVKPCANGDQGIQAILMNGAIVIFQHNLAVGYIDINHCPACGAIINTGVTRHETTHQ